MYVLTEQELSTLEMYCQGRVLPKHLQEHLQALPGYAKRLRQSLIEVESCIQDYRVNGKADLRRLMDWQEKAKHLLGIS